MASTYTVNLGIEKIGTGEQSGTWGDTTNTNFDLIDQAINGAVTVTLASAGTSGSPNTLAITDGTVSDGRNKFIDFADGGDLGAAAYIQLTPNDAEKLVHIRNSLSGGRSIFVFQGTYNASNDFEIPNGKDVVLKFDGAGASATVTDVFTDLQATAITTPDLTATTADINGGTIDGTVIGGTTPAAGSFTTLQADTSLNVDGTVTADGLTVDGDTTINRAILSSTASDPALEISGRTDSSNLDFKFTDTDGSVAVNQVHHKSEYYATDGTQVSAKVRTEYADVSGGMNYVISTSGAGVAVRDRLKVASTGDISFYEDTGTTPKFFWDASAEALGLGTTSPSYTLHVNSGGTNVAALLESTDSNVYLNFKDSDTVNEAQIGAIGDNLVMRTNVVERVRIDSSGNVGIGTSSPATALDVVGTVTADGLTVNTNVATGTLATLKGSTGFGFTFSSNAVAPYVQELGVGGGEEIALTSGGKTLIRLEDNNDIFFYEDTGTTPKFFWDASAEALGIGTTSPATRLELSGVKDTSELRLSSTTNDASWAADQYFGKLSFYSADSSGAGAGVKGSIVSACTGGGTGATAHMAFSVASTTTNEVERMRIDSSGNLLVGTSASTDGAFIFETTTANNKGSQINLVVLGRSSSGYPVVGYNCAPTGTSNTYNKYIADYASWIQFVSGGIDTFTTTTTATGTTTGTAGPYLSRGGTSWTSSSDRRLKDNIEGITYGLEAVKSLNPVSYVRNDRDTGVKELGFIAQEVDEVVSEVVSVREDGFYGIDYERLIPVLTKAIQEQQEIINDLRARVAQLEGA